ncbi:MAG: hypothetical protein GTO54_05380 [Nitrososphaeria archaeon]|nr:hypothetical protein [Nitrososphaeria archaeon]
MGGFLISIVYGTSVGVPAELSCAFVIFLDCFVIFASLKFSYYLSDYPRLMPHLAALRNRYRAQINLLSKYINRFHMVPTLAVINFLIGPWISMILAYGLQINVVSTIKGAAIGLFGAAAVSLALYKGLITTIPDPLLVTVISLVILLVSTTILKRSLKSRL